MYRLLDNDSVDPDDVAKSAFTATVQRCDDLGVVVVPIDGTSLNITDDARVRGTGPVGARAMGARGFQVMTAIGVAPDGTPLGLLGQATWSRLEEPAEKETKHWVKVLGDVRTRFAGHRCRPWFQLDRGGDAWPVLEAAQHDDVYVTLRAAHDRRVQPDEPEDARAYLWATLRAEEPLGHFAIDVAGRPGRAPREARMAIRAREVLWETTDRRTKKRGFIVIWAVFAVKDGTTPDGERPLEWMLLTTRPTGTFRDACTVVLAYTYR